MGMPYKEKNGEGEIGTASERDKEGAIRSIRIGEGRKGWMGRGPGNVGRGRDVSGEGGGGSSSGKQPWKYYWERERQG